MALTEKKRKMIAILQSSYIPWKGYFDIIDTVDEFVIYDDVQFTRRDWRNRNLIKTAAGLTWLTIPVITKGRYHQLISDTEVTGKEWAGKHLRSIESALSRADFFVDMIEPVRLLYTEAAEMDRLSDINRHFLEGLCRLLGITTKITNSTDYGAAGSKTDRLVAICRAAGATDYLSGPSARDYIEPEKFSGAGVGLHYMDYSGYPPYRQLHGEFSHSVSIIDLLMCEGPNARDFMRAGKPAANR